jgi:hypothetical protein
VPRSARIPTPNEVTDETMMPLSVAAAVAVARGVVTSATTKALKREADQGRLAVYEVFGRVHTTLGDIKTMMRQGAVPPRASAPSRPAARSASFEEAQGRAAQAAALERLRRIKEGRTPR